MKVRELEVRGVFLVGVITVGRAGYDGQWVQHESFVVLGEAPYFSDRDGRLGCHKRTLASVAGIVSWSGREC